MDGCGRLTDSVALCVCQWESPVHVAIDNFRVKSVGYIVRLAQVSAVCTEGSRLVGTTCTLISNSVITPGDFGSSAGILSAEISEEPEERINLIQDRKDTVNLLVSITLQSFHSCNSC
jgi:hypothetical protein